MTRTIVVGSRRSNLAMEQTRSVIRKLEALNLPYTYTIKEIVTKGDQVLDVQLSKVGGKGIFMKEIEQALHAGEIDMAVHSMKDMPSELHPSSVMAAVPPREDERDCLLSKNGYTLDTLPAGAIVGTSSLRRTAQVRRLRPDLQVKWIRGNIDTRYRKLQEEDFDAIILAAAGPSRLGWDRARITQHLEIDTFLPAVGQGAIAVECRTNDDELRKVLTHIHDEQTAQRITAERSFLAAVEGGCQVPVAGHAFLQGDDVVLTGLVASPDGKQWLKETVRDTNAERAGKMLASQLSEQGAQAILDEVRESSS